MSESRDKDGQSWEKTGHMSPEDVNLPSEERMKEKPVAVIECPQEIPCNPCAAHCPVGAIKMDDLNDTPTVDFDECTGCSICVQQCPGLAVFMVELKEDGRAEITLPHEFNLPEKGEEVAALNRGGKEVCKGEVVKTVPRENSVGDTPILTIEIPDEYINEVRSIRREKNE